MKNFKGVVSNINEHRDMIPIGNNIMTYADSRETGVNQNIIGVGSTGCGKTTSITEPQLVHLFESSGVVPVSKQSIVKRYQGEFKRRGYRTEILNFTNLNNSSVGYDPMDYVKTNEDAMDLASMLIGYDDNRKNVDPFWEDTAECLVAGIILLILENAKFAGKNPEFKDVINLLKILEYVPDPTSSEDRIININDLFEEAEKRVPDSMACAMIKSVIRLPDRTGLCVYATVKAAVDKLFTEDIIKMVENKNSIDFSRLGDEKTLLFVVTNPFNQTCSRFVNIMYSQMFKSLFEKAEQSPKGALNIPVRVICDDFACGTKIKNFDSYISIFRAAGISVTILLQSESQLRSLYGEHAATTILNNVDTYIFMGSLDDKTVQNVSIKMNLPVNKIMQMPLEQIMVMRRGSEPFVGKRYQLYDDPVYQRIEAQKEYETDRQLA